MIDKDSLFKKLYVIKEHIPQAKWMYYHIASIENFIIHLNSIKSERTRARTAEEINQYLSIIEQKSDKDQNLGELYKDLHVNYIYKISDVYKDDVGFTSKPYYPLFILIMFIAFCILQLFIPIIYALICIAVLIITWVTFKTIKVKAKKYY